MAQPSKKRGSNEPEPRPIIVKKIIVDGHGGHHGGAWKVAYADFVTAMMAFFLLLWLLGATTERQRKALADYFTPTLVEMKLESAGSNGMFGGDSLVAKDSYPTTGGKGNRSITIPRDATGVNDEGGKDMKSRDRAKFEEMKKALEKRMAKNKDMQRLRKNIRFTETREGLRIDLIDEADFSMFSLATDRLLPQARSLVAEVAKVIETMPNDVIVRGHTDALPYAGGRTMNNWMLSTARAEATRRALHENGVPLSRFARIEGVADREPYAPENVYDPRNRRMSVTLAWTGSAAASKQGSVMLRDKPEEIRKRPPGKHQPVPQADNHELGGSALPEGVELKSIR
ncbi:flagellar motor protein MotB [Rhizorhapis suberifaciens]|uniref:Chemotaxis protein MotB n=1 Tax=Rhizorhapis suberifaciens TaxID=13656 RepID=A0A840HXR8_9SPHN|nr:flagellar motor protein MotB [Rhizorhapis suberifaciens]MBB4642441.1 chemotaxis protein MotB [Rhizorhapis suberifaciens]